MCEELAEEVMEIEEEHPPWRIKRTGDQWEAEDGMGNTLSASTLARLRRMFEGFAQLN